MADGVECRAGKGRSPPFALVLEEVAGKGGE